MIPRNVALLALGAAATLVATVALAVRVAHGTALAAAPLPQQTSRLPLPGSPTRDAAASPPSFVGVIVPARFAKLAPRTDGNLVAVAVKVGQRVREGDVLARFDARDRKNELAMAEAQLRAAHGNVASAGADLAAARQRAARRNAFVVVDGERVPVVSGEEASQSVLTSHGAAGRAVSASAQVAEMRARVAQLRLQLDETVLRAPHDGVVTAVYFEPGMTVHATETVLRIVGLGDRLRVRIAVPEESRAVLAGVARARLGLDDGRVLGATLDAVSPEVDAASRTILVEGAVDPDPVDPDPARPGSPAGDPAALAGQPVRATLLGAAGELLR